jgi:hypothetical protein
MTPTQKIRWVEKSPMEYVLQQWWAVVSNGEIKQEGEWRDVPVEKEA